MGMLHSVSPPHPEQAAEFRAEFRRHNRPLMKDLAVSRHEGNHPYPYQYQGMKDLAG